MSKLFDPKVGYENLRLIEGIVIGILISIAISIAMPAKMPSIKTIERQVIVHVPFYLDKSDAKQIDCLAKNAYFEAGNQTTTGKIAVTDVVINRTNATNYPATPCEVIKQKSHGSCQFSWVCLHKNKIADVAIFEESKWVAEQVYMKNFADVTYGATYYHANYVQPYWSAIFNKTTTIGEHIFYKEN